MTEPDFFYHVYVLLVFVVNITFVTKHKNVQTYKKPGDQDYSQNLAIAS